MTKPSPKPPKIDFDSNWKEIIEKFFPQFIQHILPDLHEAVDWSRSFEFLEQEMRNLNRKLKFGRKRAVDKLAQVWLKDGTRRRLLTHIEVESSSVTIINKRLYRYYSEVYNKHDCPITALVLFVGDTVPSNAGYFEENHFGTKLAYTYNFYAVINQTEEALLKSEGVFALFLLANLYTLQTRDAMYRRLELKKEMYELAIVRNIPLKEIDDLLTFVFEILALPIEEEKEYTKFLREKESNMNTSAEKQYQKRVSKHHRLLANIYSEAEFGATPEQLIKRIQEKDETLKKVLTEKDKVLTEKDKVLTEKEAEFIQVVKRLHSQKHMGAAEIAEMVNRPVAEIEQMIIS